MTSQEKRTLVVTFRIEGNLRFLSHQETMTMWCRALTRSGVDVCFSSGYNPHPRLSLPLPRSVGVAACDELLCAQVWDVSEPASRIQNCLPEGCIVTNVELREGKASFHAVSAAYEFPLRAPAARELSARVSALNASAGQAQAITVQRRVKDSDASRPIDVGPYIASAVLAGDRVTVHSRITPAGTVRVDEIMQLLGLEPGDLSGWVTRTSVQWERN